MDKLLGKINEAKVILENINKTEKSPTDQKKRRKDRNYQIRNEELPSLQTLK